jgi:hypothetical protein
MHSLLARLSYRRELIYLARALGLQGILRKCYYRLARASNVILGLEIGGIAGPFHVPSVDALRNYDVFERATLITQLAVGRNL